MTITKQSAQGVSLWMNDSRIHRNMKITQDDSAVNSAAVTDPALHS